LKAKCTFLRRVRPFSITSRPPTNALGLQFKEELDVLTADGIKKSTGKA